MPFGNLEIVMESLALTGEICSNEPHFKPVAKIQLHPIEHT
jgi:hypothetical protein